MTITTGEQVEIDRANASAATPLLFVHGLWLLRSSWQGWRDAAESLGFVTLAPGWPDDPETVEDARAHPEVFAGKGVGAVTDHYAAVIAGLDREPVVVGHSFGGLIAQKLAGQGWPGRRSRSTRRRSAACCRCRSRRSGRPPRCSPTRRTGGAR